MPRIQPPADQIVESAIGILNRRDYGLRLVLDDLEAAVYVTDGEGLVIYANDACARFAGREPQLGVDRWCVTWKLYTESGEFLPHEECPMAAAIKSRSPIRGVSAIAERPDGTRVAFTPIPTPIFGRDETLLGAVNILMPHEGKAA